MPLEPVVAIKTRDNKRYFLDKRDSEILKELKKIYTAEGGFLVERDTGDKIPIYRYDCVPVADRGALPAMGERFGYSELVSHTCSNPVLQSAPIDELIILQGNERSEAIEFLDNLYTELLSFTIFGVSLEPIPYFPNLCGGP